MLRYAARVSMQACLRTEARAACFRLAGSTFRPNVLLAANNSAQSNLVTPSRDLHLNARLCGAHAPYTIKTVHDRLMLVAQLYDKVDPDKVTMESDFFKDLGLDSLDYVELIVMIEDEFQFEIPAGDSDRFKCLRDVYQYICDREDVYE